MPNNPNDTGALLDIRDSMAALSITRLANAASGVVKASAGQLCGGTVVNSNAAIRFLHLYNKATAPTVGTDTPIATIPLPPNVSVTIGTEGLGASFATGMAWAFTTDNIAVPATAGLATDLHGTLFFR